jgi:tRNA dimethylallyltransferase
MALVVAIVGPTASGKTALSIEVATRIGGEIISMDSRQIYRGMDIGTAKASTAQRARVPHHGLDLVDPDERFSAGRFARWARARIEEISRRGAVPMLVGGTGFFLRALTHPIFQEPRLDPVRREALSRFLAERDEATLRRWVEALDEPSAHRLSTWGGRQRLLRALELPLLTGRPLSWWHAHAPPEADPLRPLTFVLDLPIATLDTVIARRVNEMVLAGLVDEVASLVRRGYNERTPGMNATGYVELIPYLRGEIPLEAALEAVRRNTRAYARRQMTWLRHQLPPGAIRLDATRPPADRVDEIVQEVGAARRDFAPEI